MNVIKSGKARHLYVHFRPCDKNASTHIAPKAVQSLFHTHKKIK